MATLDYQIAYGGVTMGPGTPYRILTVTGLRDLPDVRTTDLPRLKHPGSYSGLDVLSSRVITAQLAVVGAGPDGLEAALSALETATAILATGVSPLSWKLPSRAVQHYLARPRRRSAPLVPSYRNAWTMIAVEWFCPDPVAYAGES